MKALALDFDGVLFDSARETFLVGSSTYAEFFPDSPLVRRLGETSAAGGHPANFAAFSDLLPLGNRAEDFGVAFRAMDQGVRIPDQEAYDSFYALQDEGWRAEYHHRFYIQRATLRDGNRGSWIDLHAPYQPLLDLLRRRADEIHVAVASAKDAASVRLLLEAFGVGDLFPAGTILDKETGVHKTDHVTHLRDRLDIDFHQITFVDDKVNHLRRVAELGVRPVLAGWGFNTDREHRLASELGFLVSSLESFELDVFGE